MSKSAKWIIGILIVLLVLSAAAAFAIIGYLQPYRAAQNTMVEGQVVLYLQEDGSVQFTWPAAVNADRYVFEILRPAEETAETADSGETDVTEPVPEVLYRAVVYDGPEHTVPNFSATNEYVIVRIRSIKGYFFPFEEKERLRYGDEDLSISGDFQTPQISNLVWLPDANEKKVDIQFELPENSVCRMYYVPQSGEPVLLEKLKQGSTSIAFGETEMFSIPTFNEQHTFSFDVYSEYEGYIYYGLVTDQFSVTREHMLGTELELNCISEGNNVFSFTWNEVKGESYELQYFDSAAETWVTMYRIPKDGERSFTTGHLSRYSSFKFRVIALTENELSATPAEVQVNTGASLIYSTIWPIQDLELYSNTNRNQVLGTANAGTAYCILDEKDGLFYIRAGDSYGYVDSNYCMINLPDFIGNICLYDITNSYQSIYKAHIYDIPTITGEVIAGYENIKLTENEYLVPLLYPVALKLEKAAFAAMEEGYMLKIYDSFRPQTATKLLYDEATVLCKEVIPEEVLAENPMEEPPELDAGQELTYEALMTDNGRYSMNYFLAKGTSRHNQGLAVDLTLVDLWNGEELQMQTAMHDLSWYSELNRNNANANTLSRIMLEAGFADLSSEWWHFQDDEARSQLSPEALWSGVTPEGWKADDNGWRYRTADGVYYVDCSATIDGVEYHFDGNGYAQ